MRTALFCLLLLLSVPAMAEAPGGTQVSLSSQAEKMLPNDEVVVRFRIEAEGPSASALRRKVNRISRAVSERLGHEKGVIQATTGRRIEPIWRYDKGTHRQIRTGWRLVQSGQATSTHPDAVPDWVDAIEQAGAHLDGLSYRVSREAGNAARERLRMQAIAEFRARAAATAKALGAASFRILHLNTDTVMPGPIRPMMAMANKAREADASTPALEAGQSRITVRVSGDILLPEQDYSVR